MAWKHTTSKSLVSIVGAAIVALGLVTLFGNLDGPESCLMTNLFDAAARTVLKALLSLVPAAWQALQGYVFDHRWFSPCPLQMVTTFCSLLHVIAGAA